MRAYAFIMTGLCILIMMPGYAYAEVSPVPNAALLEIARQFVTRVSQKFDEADQAMGKTAVIPLPEGEQLLFNISLTRKLSLDNVITGEVHQQQILLSLNDYLTALEFPVSFDGQKAEGWYIREDKSFRLDADNGTVESDQGRFTFSENVIIRDGDILVPVNELARWFGFNMTADVSRLQIALESAIPLPIQDRIARGARKFAEQRSAKPVLPYHPDPEKMLEMPLVDVIKRSGFSRSGEDGKSTSQHTATVATAGDLAYGTLRTQSQFNDEDKLSSARVTYKKETLEPELLGPLKARKYEIGDITPLTQPLTDSLSSGVGVHVTNADPLRATLDATTGISGYALPGWDVELYRGNQILDTQIVGEDGRYNFDRVDLFSSDNNFRVVLYGPQGEVREENIYIPVDTQRLVKSGSAYDISLTMDDTQAYRAAKTENEDQGAPHLNAQFEIPVADASRLKLGFEAGQQDGESEAIVHTGLSTTVLQTLLNANAAVDEKGETAAELVARRNFGEHGLRNTLQVSSKNFQTTAIDEDDDEEEIFSNRLNLNGPLAIGIGNRPRYSLGLDYGIDAQGDNETRGNLGFNTGFGRLSFNQQFTYALDQDEQIDSITSLSGPIGRTRLRLTSEYEIKPENALQNLRGTLQRPVTQDVDMTLGLSRDMQAQITEGTAQLNWHAGHVLVSPSVSYNTEGDMTAVLNTRFGLAHDPQPGKIRMFERPVSLDGGLSVFVFLDQNGNGIADDGEPPVPDAMIAAPQNGGRSITDEDGYAFFTGLQKLRLTDVYLEPDSLQDPYWLPASRGVSVLPREGHVTQLIFPVVMAGEIEGTLFSRLNDGMTFPAAGTAVTLYDRLGDKIIGTTTGDDGYYLLSPIPPGDYLIVVGNTYINNDGFVRPAPMPVSIGYDGPVISGQDIYMAEGPGDAPVRMLASTDALQSDEPALDIRAIQDKAVILNLGTYRSRLLMGVTWYKTRLLQAEAVAGMQALVAPADSYAAAKTGMHTLRIGMPALTYDNASKRCGLLNAAGIPCIVEILPGGLQVARL